MQKLPFKAFFQRIQDEEGNYIGCWVVDSEVDDSFMKDVKESIIEPIESCAIWIGYVFIDGDELSHVEGEWKDATDRFYAFVNHLLNENQDRLDL